MADIVSTVSTALNIASRLKAISDKIRDAEFRNLVADLSIELAEVKLKAASLLEENAGLREQLLKLQSAGGERCPKCGNRTFELIGSRPHPTFGEVGVVERTYKCSDCGFQEAKTVET